MNQIKKIIDEIDENKFTSQEVINFINNQNERESWVSLKDVKQIIQKQFNSQVSLMDRGLSVRNSKSSVGSTPEVKPLPGTSILDDFCKELKEELHSDFCSREFVLDKIKKLKKKKKYGGKE